MITEMIGRATLLARAVSNRKLDAIDLLRMDHMKVELIFLQIRTAKKAQRRQQLFKRLHKELESHTHIEEAVFYPACEKVEGLKDMVLESREEHKQVKTLLREIDKLSTDSEKWDPKLWLLMENVEHHVREEENRFFPKVRRYLDRQELAKLADELMNERNSSSSKQAA